MRVHLANKILSGFSAILSLILLGTCIWILTSLLIGKHESGKEDCKLGSSKYDDGSLCNNSTQQPSFEDEHSGFEGTDAVVIDNTKLTRKSKMILMEFEEMNSTFHLIIVICLSCAIVTSLTQFICSLVIICSPPYKMATRSRKVLVILFIAFIVFLTCFSLSIAFKRSYSDGDDPMHTITTLNTLFSDFIMNFEMNHLFKDLTLYYIEIFANSIFLFFYMVITCCLLRCIENDSYNNYDI